MFQTIISTSNRLTLDQVIARLRASGEVDGAVGGVDWGLIAATHKGFITI